MSTPAHFDLEIISQTDIAQSSLVPTHLPDDPYVAVRHAYLVNTDTKFEPLEDLRETKIPQPLLVVPSPVSSSDDFHLTVRHAHTPATVDIESEPEDAPSEIEKSLALVFKAPLIDEEFEASEPSNTRTTSSHSLASSISTAPLSPDHPLTQASPTPTPTQALFHRRTVRMTVRAQLAMSPGLSTRVTEVMTLSDSAFRKRYRSSYETPSPSPTLLVQKTYQGISELILDIKTEDDKSKTEGAGSRSEESRDKSSDLEKEAALEGQQQAVPVVGTIADEPLDLGYGDLRRRELARG
nr:hypothetical protein [Tanacetum cinerariifolium]